MRGCDTADPGLPQAERATRSRPRPHSPGAAAGPGERRPSDGAPGGPRPSSFHRNSSAATRGQQCLWGASGPAWEAVELGRSAGPRPRRPACWLCRAPSAAGLKATPAPWGLGPGPFGPGNSPTDRGPGGGPGSSPGPRCSAASVSPGSRREQVPPRRNQSVETGRRVCSCERRHPHEATQTKKNRAGTTPWKDLGKPRDRL